MQPLEAVANVVYLPASEITPQAVKNADALVVRTRTRCNEALLGGSDVKIVATATIGTDHIDLDWCAANGIKVVNAPGCNAPAVAQYVFGALARLINRPLSSYCIGIVGVGNVGRIVEAWARSLEMRVMLCDPLRQQAEGGDGWSTLQEVAERADIITFHTPLTTGGDHPTWHLADRKFFESLRRAPIIVNSARGEVVDNKAWLAAVRAGVAGAAVVDCWENEPDICPELLVEAAFATPHIAGYSRQGKQRASAAALGAVCEALGLELPARAAAQCPPPARTVTLPSVAASYNPDADTRALRANPQNFESLRNNYNLRDEAPETIAH